jgi:tetratricopeptide (TPR) repeat protein
MARNDEHVESVRGTVATEYHRAPEERMPEARGEETAANIPAPNPHPRIPPATAFLACLAVLLLAGLLPWIAPAPKPSGLPDDPQVRAAAALVQGRLALPASGLRFTSSLAGDSPTGVTEAPDLEERISQAARLLRDARSRDTRIEAAIAALDLAAGRYPSASRRYRRAIGRSSVYPEAHLGLGMVLALEAQAATYPVLERRLELQALAQFAAVPKQSMMHPIALYDRAVMLERVGRADEARRRAREYLALDSTSSWADAMRRVAGS